MGLDQYAGVMPEDKSYFTAVFVWRKHSKFQAWAEALFEKRQGNPPTNLIVLHYHSISRTSKPSGR